MAAQRIGFGRSESGDGEQREQGFVSERAQRAGWPEMSSGVKESAQLVVGEEIG